MAARQLPLEMISAIIDHLHNDKPTLKACSLVCKAWTHPARLHLFSSLTVKWPLQPASFPFVRHLRLATEGKRRNDAPSWDNVISLLVGFHRIVSLNVVISWRILSATNPSPQIWSTLSKNFSGIVSLSLTHFNAAHISALARVICSFPSLRELYLGGSMNPTKTDAFESDQESTAPFRLSPDLGTLDLGVLDVAVFLEWLLSVPVFPSFHTVRLRQALKFDIVMVQKFIEALGDHLESFTLSEFVVDLPHHRYTIDITPLTHLRSIQFLLYSTNNNGWITYILSQISSLHVEDVLFQLPSFANANNFDLSNALEWSEIDSILQRSTFSQLRNVELRSHMPLWKCDPVPDPGPSLSVQIMERLPLCHARGIFLGQW